MDSTSYWNQMYANAIEGGRPFILMAHNIKMSIDGDKWCALFGENIQDGIAGFGESPDLAAWDFDKQWCQHIKFIGDNQ